MVKVIEVGKKTTSALCLGQSGSSLVCLLYGKFKCGFSSLAHLITPFLIIGAADF
jgi:hypothetical protein